MTALLQHRTAPLVEDVTGLDAAEALRKLAGLRHVLFLDSAQTSSLRRYSYLAAEPFHWLTARDRSIHLNGKPHPAPDPFTALATLLAAYTLPVLPELPPFQGGAAGLFGYELCHHLERLPRPTVRDFDVPDLAVGLYDWVLSFDHLQERAWLISTGLPETTPRRRGQRAAQRRDQVLRWLERGVPPAVWSPPERLMLQTQLHRPPAAGADRPGVRSNFSHAAYLRAVERAIDYIHAGDCFQVNLAQRLVAPQRRPPLDIYQDLRERNPAPLAGYFDLGPYVLASASPERFLKVEDGDVETRPIKGTRPRGATAAEDRVCADELRRSAKDRAENVMIVDLLRNDLGRVCEYGSIRVEALCRLESYPFVHHLVSEVRGRLRAGKGAVDLLRAAFPGGSVTGAPKIRAMEIITELEGVARGPYCGSFGYLGFNGAMDTSILIRTLVLGGGWVHFAVGGGIVADSHPQREYEETWHKARGLLRALEE